MDRNLQTFVVVYILMVELCLVSLERFGGASTKIESRYDMSFRGALEKVGNDLGRKILSLEERQKSAPREGSCGRFDWL